MDRDGAAFFIRQSIATAVYDRLFAAPSIDGDIAHYEALCRRSGGRILDAGRGTGRIARALARPDRLLSAFDASTVLLTQFRRKQLQAPAPPHGVIATFSTPSRWLANRS